MSGKLDQDAAKVKIESDLACLTSAQARNTLPTHRRGYALVRHTPIRSCFSSAFQTSSFDLIRLSQREAAHRRTRKFSRTGIHGGPSVRCGAAFFVGNCKLTTTGQGLSEAQLLAAGFTQSNTIGHF